MKKKELCWYLWGFFCSDTESCLTQQPHGLQHTRLSCPLLFPRICSDSCPLSWWFHPTISSSVTPFSSCLQSFPASGPFPVNWLFALVCQNIGALASVLPMNIRGWFPLELTGLVSLLSKGLSWVFSSTTSESVNSLMLSLLSQIFWHLYLKAFTCHAVGQCANTNREERRGPGEIGITERYFKNTPHSLNIKKCNFRRGPIHYEVHQ